MCTEGCNTSPARRGVTDRPVHSVSEATVSTPLVGIRRYQFPFFPRWARYISGGTTQFFKLLIGYPSFFDSPCSLTSLVAKRAYPPSNSGPCQAKIQDRELHQVARGILSKHTAQTLLLHRKERLFPTQLQNPVP